MFPCLASRPWHTLCRVSLQHKTSLSQRPSRIPQLCHGECPSVIVRGEHQWLSFLSQGSIFNHRISQDGRVDEYTAGGSTCQSAESRLRGWARSTTTLPPEAIKMFLLHHHHHRVVLHRLSRSYLPPCQVPLKSLRWHVNEGAFGSFFFKCHEIFAVIWL